MASSTYLVSIVGAHYPTEQKQAKASVDFYPENSNDFVRIIKQPGDMAQMSPTDLKKILADDQDKTPYLMIKGRYSHTCRETLLHLLKHFMTGFTSAENYRVPVAFVEYCKEMEEPLSSRRVEKIKAISNKFLNSPLSANIQIVKDFQKTNSVLLAIRWDSNSNGQLMSDLLKLSMILYVFRHEPIMDAILEEFPGDNKIYLSSLMLFLSRAFLENGWGDNANPSLAMSMFCHKASRGLNADYMDFYVNGPAKYSMYLSNTMDIICFLKEIYIPFIGTTEINTKSNHFGSLSDSLKTSLVTLMGLLPKTERKSSE